MHLAVCILLWAANPGAFYYGQRTRVRNEFSSLVGWSVGFPLWESNTGPFRPAGLAKTISEVGVHFFEIVS